MRRRIAITFAVLLGLSTFVSTAILRQVLLDRAGQRVEDALVQEVDEFRKLVRGRNPQTGRLFGRDVRAIFNTFLSRNVVHEAETIYTFVDGRPFRATRPGSAPPGVAALGRVTKPTRGDIGRLRYLAVPVLAGRRSQAVFVVTIDREGDEAEVRDAVQVAAGISVGVLVLALGLSWVLAGRTLAPLRSATDTARSITESDLTRRVPVGGDGEVAELARTFNSMLDRLEGAFASQRAFVADAGHELRTPITIVRGHLELLGDDPDERTEVLELVQDELDRMARLVEDLMLLARAERPDFLRIEELDLDALTEEVHAKASALASREWELENVAVGRLTGDRQRLTQALVNLANNAAQHTEPGDTIRIGSSLAGGVARLWVTDEGSGIAPADAKRIFDRFARAQRGRRSEGAGLGLAIVLAIARAHGGHVDLDSRPGHGSRFTLVLPADVQPIVTVDSTTEAHA